MLMRILNAYVNQGSIFIHTNYILLQSITLQARQVQSPLARYYTISQILVSDDLPRTEYCNYFLFVVAES